MSEVARAEIAMLCMGVVSELKVGSTDYQYKIRAIRKEEEEAGARPQRRRWPSGKPYLYSSSKQ